MASRLDFRVERRPGVAVGAELAARIRMAAQDGTLTGGDRLPSVRELAEAAGVNVNTARAVYTRLEAEGVVRSEQGRGTFVSGTPGDEAAARRELHRQIAQLEAALARLPPRPVAADERPAARRPGPALLSTEGLEAVRDELLQRLGELEAERAAVMLRLERLGVEDAALRASSRRDTPSLAGARIRWVGA